MIKDLKAVSLVDILPDNLLADTQVYAAAKALDDELQRVTVATWEALHLPRLDELPEAVLDLLAWQWHVDFYEPMGMSVETKRSLIRKSIAWHRMKGTPAAVEEVVTAAFEKATVSEWFDYGGSPFFFRVTTEDATTDTQTIDAMRRSIETVKNVRSVLEGIQFIIHFSDNYGEMAETLNMIARSMFEDTWPWDFQHYGDGGTYGVAITYGEGHNYGQGLKYAGPQPGGRCYGNEYGGDTMGIYTVRPKHISDEYAAPGNYGDVWEYGGGHTYGGENGPADAGGHIAVKKIYRYGVGGTVYGNPEEYGNGALYGTDGETYGGGLHYYGEERREQIAF